MRAWGGCSEGVAGGRDAVAESTNRERRERVVDHRVGEPVPGVRVRLVAVAGDCDRLVEALPDEFDAILAGCSGDETAADTTWSAKAYVFHVADNLRIFAERLQGVFAGAPTTLA